MKILMAGAQGIVQDGLKLVLKSTWPECKMFETAKIEKKSNLIAKWGIDLAILEMNMPGNENMEDLVRSITGRTKVIVLAPYDKNSHRTESLQNAGVSEVIFKDTTIEEMQMVLLSMFALGSSLF